MSKPSDKQFSRKSLENRPLQNFRLQVVKEDDIIHQAEVWERKTFLGMFPRMVFVADLLAPVRKVADDIEEAKRKLKNLKQKREEKYLEAIALMRTFPNVYDGPPLSIKNLASKTKAEDLSGKIFDKPKGSSKKDDKPKTMTVVRNAVKAPAHRNQNQKGKGNNNQHN